jgi:hypothetical protein
MMFKINLKLFIIITLLSLSLVFGGIRQTDQTKRLKFAKGKSAVTVSDAVLRDEVHYYLVKANQGQTMTVKITSLEKNASFRIIKPSGGYVQGASEMEEPTNWTGTLPESGDYKIEVGPDRGNATYRLTVRIK